MPLIPAHDPYSTYWVDVFRVTIQGQPVPKGRPRMSRSGHTFTPERTRVWEAHAVATMLDTSPRPRCLDGLIKVYIEVCLKRPKRLCRAQDYAGRIFAPVRPDVDNFAKAALDALQKAEIFKDDGQVVRLEVVKFYTRKGEDPSMLIEVSAAS